jgi:hypothetical protein
MVAPRIRYAACLLGLTLLATAPAGMGRQDAATPRPVRNDRPQASRELLVLRHHQLRKGGHQEFYRLSAENVWPYFERNGARIVGQWRIASTDGASANSDDVYRLVRYAGFDHWRATRSTRSSDAAASGSAGADVSLGGNGPAHARSIGGYASRGDLETGSSGAYFLEGVSAPGGPYFMPGLQEQYDLVQSARPSSAQAHIPVRADVMQAGDEIIEVRHQRIRKGSYDRFVSLTRASVWPWEEKLGARPLGQWLVVHPAAPSRTTASAEYDEIITLTRYASRAHRDAMQPEAAVYMGGNGPDHAAWQDAIRQQRELTLSTGVELAEGYMYQSPPKFLPGLSETYRLRP